MAVFMGTIGVITFKTKIFPKWTGWLAIIIGVINFIFVPGMFFGINTGDFYSAAGWGNSALAASLFTWWMLVISIKLIKDRNEYRI
jgi:hypothetical protein